MPNESQERGRRRSSVWREQVLTRIMYLAALAEWIKRQDSQDPPPGNSGPAAQANAALDEGIERHLAAARQAAEGHSSRPVRGASGSAMESALGSVHAAEELLLRRAPVSYVRGRLPDIHSDVRKHLAANDPRRIRLEKLSQTHSDVPMDESARENIIAAMAAAHSKSRKEFARVRSFRNVLLVTALILILISVALALMGWFRPKDLALCFYPQELSKIVCPTNESPFSPAYGIPAGGDIDDVVSGSALPGDILLVEFIGLLAAAVSGAAALRRVKGTTTPFGLPEALAVVKLPMGALTAVLGLVLMRGGFVPGLSALDSSAQIIAWAVIFGASQQLLTAIVDRQAQTVLEQFGGKPHSEADRPATE
jgi:hypothetical protein